MEGSNLLKMVQQKLDEKEEVIHEQQRQINELTDLLAEKDAVIRELLGQATEDETATATASTGNTAIITEKDELIHEQMTQILELSERVEQLEQELAGARELLVEFEKVQAQLKSLLGE